MSHPERWISQLSGHLVKMDWAKHLLAVFCNILSEPYLIFAIPEHHSFHVPEPYTDSDFTVLECKARSHFFSTSGLAESSLARKMAAIHHCSSVILAYLAKYQSCLVPP